MLGLQCKYCGKEDKYGCQFCYELISDFDFYSHFYDIELKSENNGNFN